MKTMFFVLVLAAMFLVGSAEAQDADVPPVGMYPYNVFNEEPLSVGDSVWVNLGDTPCAYNETGYPSASKGCLDTYYQATIIRVFLFGGRDWVYTVDIKPKKENWEFLDALERNAPFDDLFEVINLPEEWASFSTYFLALNW